MVDENGLFHFFPELPPEIRDEIWRLCLPRRVRELDGSWSQEAFPDQAGKYAAMPCELWQTSRINNTPPVISRVCRESRSVALETGKYHFDGWSLIGPPETIVQAEMVSYTWEDLARDHIHLNWTPQYEGQFMHCGSPLHRLAFMKSHLSGSGSFMFPYIHPRRDRPDKYNAPDRYQRPGVELSFNPGTTCNLTPLKEPSDWLVVMRVVVVHADFESAAATGLFGVLGEERVQVIDIAEEGRVAALYALAETCESQYTVTTPQTWSRESSDMLRQRLRQAVMETFDSDADRIAAGMRPAIMFRLCTNMCNNKAISEQRDKARLEMRTEIDRRRGVTRRGENYGRGRGRVLGRR